MVYRLVICLCALCMSVRDVDCSHQYARRQRVTYYYMHSAAFMNTQASGWAACHEAVASGSLTKPQKQSNDVNINTIIWHTWCVCPKTKFDENAF